MSLRAWFTGKPAATAEATAPPQPTNEEKLHTMRSKRAALQRRHNVVRESMHACIEEARRYGSSGQKTLALEALRRKAVHEREFKQVGDLMRTMDQQLSVIETAALSATVATSMRDGASVMASVHSDLDVAAIERDMVDMRIKTREAEQATRLMTRPLFSTDADRDEDIDEDEAAALDAELTAILAAESTSSMDAMPAASETAPTRRVVVDAVASSSSSSSSSSSKTARELERELGL